ncbi:MAG TPA: isoprenylcysteine carboxylmethyltransferase family protein [Phenylobacterium sp.]|nr:isoprenylcysteine carboxylmethyltransferase family protein [Phenylobacterium sp.]
MAERASDVLWAAFLVSWYAAMLWTARAVARTSWLSRLGDYAIYFLGFGLLFTPAASVPPLWPTPEPVGYGLMVLEVAAFAFAWWARVHLGSLWSGMITLREGHHVVDTGPYRLVRHPIYTGFIGAAWALALITPTPAKLAGAVVLTLQMAWKARREEAFLRHELGPDAYDAYSARTPMLVPFTRR